MGNGIIILETLIKWMRENEKNNHFEVSVGKEVYHLNEVDLESLERILRLAESIDTIKYESMVFLRDVYKFLK